MRAKLIPHARVLGLCGALACLATPAATVAGPINTNAAIAPGEGATVLRLLYVYAESDGQDRIAHVNTSALRTTLIHGVSEDLALFLSVPVMSRRVDMFSPNMGRIENVHDGIGDITVMAKYRFWFQDPEPQSTIRLASLVGLNIRSGDSDFSSDSYDPLLGTAFTWRKERDKFDADLIYQFNTGGGEMRHDVLRYDAAYSYRVAPAEFEHDHTWEFDAVGEINGLYRTDGSHTLFLSPGFQYITGNWIFETSIQIPVTQDGEEPETDYRVVAGIRVQW